MNQAASLILIKQQSYLDGGATQEIRAQLAATAASEIAITLNLT